MRHGFGADPEQFERYIRRLLDDTGFVEDSALMPDAGTLDMSGIEDLPDSSGQ